jgi:hypothetical protein
LKNEGLVGRIENMYNMDLKIVSMKTVKPTSFGRIYLMISIPVGIILSIIFWISMEKNRSYLIDNYPTIEKSTEISGRVSKVNLNRGLFAIDLSNGKRVKSMDDITDFKKHDIAFFLKEYDSIFKKANSDTIIVKRFRENYYFILRY